MGFLKNGCGWQWRLLIAGAAVTTPSLAAELPAHEPISVLVVSDGVNPHGLSSDDLTEPGDISAALSSSGTGLSVDEVVEVSSDCVDDALTLLEGASAPDVILYFAHRAAETCAGDPAQVELTTAFEDHLETGGGILAFHHGLYTATGKDAVLGLLGGVCDGVDWDTTEGQRIVNVAEGHFVTTQGLTYEGTHSLAGGSGFEAGDYDYFDNIPDERYPTTTLLTEAGEDRTVLFATDSGGLRPLGWTLERPGWQGRVVAYQPGEYQPDALDDVNGNSFQILANALYFVAGRDLPSDPGGDGDGDGDGGTNPGDGDGDGDQSVPGSGGTSSNGDGDGDASPGSGASGSDSDEVSGADGGSADEGGGCQLGRGTDSPTSLLWVCLALFGVVRLRRAF